MFGHIVSGLDVLRKIEKLGTSSGKPTQKVTIVDCGELQGGGKDPPERKE